MSSTVREEVVDDQTSDWEEEDDKTPEELVDWWAAGFEDLDWQIVSYESFPKGEKLIREQKGGDVLKTMISRIKTMKPMTPPPVPYFQAFSWTAWVSMG